MEKQSKELFNGEIRLDEINNWLNQFKNEEQYYINKLLDNFVYFDNNRVRKAVKSLHQKIIRSSSSTINNMWFIPVGYVTKSGSIIAYYYRSVNELDEGNFISSKDIARIINKENVSLVFIDDYIGTGHQSEQVWKFIIQPYVTFFEKSKFYYCTLAGTYEGINYIKEHTGFEVVVDKIIHKYELPFSKESLIFEDEIERRKAEEIVKKYGEFLYPGNPIGYKNSQSLIGFFYSTPNNTLPIFWSTNEKWHPLLPRNESFRDPKNLIGSIAGLSDQIITSSPQESFYEISKLEEYDVSPEFITKGVSVFKTLPNVLALIPPMKKLKFDEEIFIKIISLIERMKRNIHEKEAIMTSILLVSDGIKLSDIGNCYLIPQKINVCDTDEIIALAGILHNYNNAIVINSKGTVLGVINLYETDNKNVFLPIEFNKILAASKKVDGLAVLCNGDDRVSIVFAGERILLYRGASWSICVSNLNSTILKLSMKYNIDSDLLVKVFKIVFRMSYIGKGALITIGDENKVLSFSENPALSFIRNLNLNILEMETDSVIGIMEQDGATIINSSGVMLQAMTFLRPPSNAPGKIEANKGSKHSTAVRISALTDALVIAVSVDGRITIYKNGDIVIKMMG